MDHFMEAMREVIIALTDSNGCLDVRCVVSVSRCWQQQRMIEAE